MNDYPEWTVRTIEGVEVIRVHGKDWTQVSSTNVPAGYPDEVVNRFVCLYHKTGHIEVILGGKRYTYVEGDDGLVLETHAGNTPQRVVLQPYVD